MFFLSPFEGFAFEVVCRSVFFGNVGVGANFGGNEVECFNHIVGEGATELIHIGQAVLNLDGTLEYFMENVGASP